MLIKKRMALGDFPSVRDIASLLDQMQVYMKYLPY